MSDTPAPGAPADNVVAMRRDAVDLVDRLDSIANVLTGLGTAGDKGTTGRPDLTRGQLNRAELRCLYAFNGYAKRFIDIVPDDCVRKAWDVLADDGAVDVMEGEDKRLGITGKIADVHRWARLDGGAALLLVTDDAATRTDAPDALSMPLDLETLEAVLNIVVLDGTEVQPLTFGDDPRSENFGLPETWMLTPGGHGRGRLSVEVHTSRVIYFPGTKRTPSERFTSGSGLDDSVLEAAWDHIRNLTTTDQGGAILAQELKTDTLKVQGLASLATSDEQLTFYETKIRALMRSMSMLNMRILDSGDDYTSEAANVTGYRDLSEGARVALSAVTGIPQVILYGSSPGGLNADGESARTIWDRVISAVQTNVLLPRLERLYEVLFSATEGPTAGKLPDEWSIDFHPLDEPDAATEAATRKSIAETDAIYIGVGVVTPEDVTESRFGEKGYQTELQPIALDDDPDLGTPDEAAALLADLDDEAPADEVEVDEVEVDEVEVDEVEVDEVEAPAAEAPPVAASATALNGAQVASAKAIVADVAAGLLPRESGLAMLELFFNLPAEDAARIMATVGQGFDPEAPSDDEVAGEVEVADDDEVAGEVAALVDEVEAVADVEG